MHCNEVKYYLHDYSRGILLNEFRTEIHEHLNYCKNCAKALDDLISSSSSIKVKKKNTRQNEKILEKVQRENGKSDSTKKFIPKVFSSVSTISSEADNLKNTLLLKTNEIENNKLFVAAGIISIISLGVIVALLIFNNSSTSFWLVEKVSGKPKIGTNILADQGILLVGERLTTNSKSRARLKIGSEGEIDVEPNTEIHFIETKTFEHRLILSKGQIAARTWIKPKTYSIETPSAIITDLGCDYDLVVNDRASTSLHVESGWVQMKYKNTKALLCAGTMCISDSIKGVGTPFFKDATKLFKESLYRLDISSNNKSELITILSEASPNDLISLFNLLKRLDRESRAKIFDRISSLYKIPKGITREGIMNGNDAMMGRLWTELGLGSISMYHNL
jgi:hypothetical protein